MHLLSVILHPPVFLRELEISRTLSNDLIFPEEAIPSCGSRKYDRTYVIVIWLLQSFWFPQSYCRH